MNTTSFSAPLPTADKPNHAVGVDDDGVVRRTIWGYMLPDDIDVIEREYPEVPREFVEALIERGDNHVELVPAPRLLEVLTPIELLARFLRGEYSKIKRGIPEGLNLVANPLSILSFVDGVVKRVITPETEMMHKPAEKLALRTGAVANINTLLSQHFGLQLAFGCSCCALMFAEGDAEAVLTSDYYLKREQQGRHWDSDVLAALGRLHGPVPVAEVHQVFFDGSVDFGREEVLSYQRFARIAQACIAEHPNDNIVNVNEWFNRAACFVGGQCQRQGDHCPIPPAEV